MDTVALRIVAQIATEFQDEDKKLSKDLEETCISLSLALLQKETHKASSLKQNKENERLLAAIQARVEEYFDNYKAACLHWEKACEGMETGDSTIGTVPKVWLFDLERCRLASAARQHIETYLGERSIIKKNANELSLRFFRNHCVHGYRPTIITGMGKHLVPCYGFEWLRRCVPKKQIVVYQKGSHRSLGQRQTELMTVNDYLDALENGKADGMYLFDCSIPKYLPTLLENLRIPRYFAHDYLTRTMRDHAWSKAWPALFVGAAGTQSSLHVDQWHGSFWMVMVSGHKRWTLFHPDDMALLYPSWSRGTLAPEFPTLEELQTQPNKYPGFCHARKQVVVISPGDVLFVPGGTPHHVENLGNTISYAGNFVDAANFDRVLQDMKTMGWKDGQLKQAYSALDEVELDAEMGMHDDIGQVENLVVPYAEYASGESASWPFQVPLECSFASKWAPSINEGIQNLDGAMALPKFCSPTPKERCVDHLDDEGYAVLGQVLTKEEAFELKCYLQGEILKALDSNEAPAGDPNSAFAKIHTRKHRYDLRLGMTDMIKKTLHTIVGVRYASVYNKILPADASLVELGVITSLPGAPRQVIHSDVEFDADARKVFTTFVALQDITADMGPTEIWESTHTEYFCSFYKPRMLGPVDPYYDKNPPKKMAIEAGNASLIDTRVMHCGGENSAESPRMLFHFSFETSSEPNAPKGFTYNLTPELRGKYSLKTISEL
eukprot:m.187407 g.187407  ORF g.187407 m.187407 type:complete len:723 (-) comp15608_c0_seq2:5437-7605(-)